MCLKIAVAGSIRRPAPPAQTKQRPAARAGGNPVSQPDLFQRPPSALPPVPSDPLLCLSIRQPWAHMILHHGKDIENRTWPTKVRGRILIHASMGMTNREWVDAWDFAKNDIGIGTTIRGPARAIHFGGIVGSVEIVDCVQHSDSAWFSGPWGFVLRNPQPVEFTPCRGALRFFRRNDQAEGRRE